MQTKTISQRARERATRDRIRALYKRAKKGGLSWYKVFNLSKHTVYKVYQCGIDRWRCTCPTDGSKQRCKHVQRVLDREEARDKQEALSEVWSE